MPPGQGPAASPLAAGPCAGRRRRAGRRASALAGACLAGLLLVAGPARADDLPPGAEVPMRLAPNGLPATLQGFIPLSPHIVPHESGCGMLEARHADGRLAVLVFAPGTEDTWGPVLLYIISGPDDQVTEWAGDPKPVVCFGAP